MPKHPTLDERISVLIDGQLPDFVRANHQTFITFLRAYYEWMEEEGNALEVIGNIKHYQNIDRTVSDFVEHFKRQYLNQLPETLADKEFLVKKIREFYRIRGSSESIKLLFRILYNDNDVSLRFPGEEVLRVSDGKWEREKFIRFLFTDDTPKMVGQRIIGETSKAEATVESVIRFAISGGVAGEGIISNVNGDFIAGETLNFIDSEGNALTQTLVSIVNEIRIDNPGKDYVVGDIVDIGDVHTSGEISKIISGPITGVSFTSGTGSGYVVDDYLVIDNTNKLDIDGISAVVRVTGVDGSGGITSLEIENGGRNYNSVPTTDGSTHNGSGTGAVITFEGENIGGIKEIRLTNIGFNVNPAPTVTFGSASGTGATATALLGSIFIPVSGRWVGTDGLLSSNRVLQDSFFYQDYSYVIRANNSIDEWRDIVINTVHPAGVALFGDVVISDLLDLQVVGEGIHSTGGQSYLQTLTFPVTSPEDISVYLDLQIDLVERGVDSVWVEDVSPSGFTSRTIEAQSLSGSSFKIFPDTEAIGDNLYIGREFISGVQEDKFRSLEFNIMIAGSGTPTIDWEYYNGSTWESLSGGNTGTFNFTEGTGIFHLNFTVPSDWATTSVNGEGGSYYYIRANLTAIYLADPPTIESIRIPISEKVSYTLTGNEYRTSGISYEELEKQKLRLNGMLKELGPFSVNTGDVKARIVDGGTGYPASPTPTIDNTGTGGTGFAVTLAATAGVIDTITVTNEGTGYTKPPLLTATEGNNDAILAVSIPSSNNVGNYPLDYSNVTLDNIINTPKACHRHCHDALIRLER